MTREEFLDWMHRNGLSIQGAADALGVSYRMVIYIRTGKKPVSPRIVHTCGLYEQARPPAAATPLPKPKAARRKKIR